MKAITLCSKKYNFTIKVPYWWKKCVFINKFRNNEMKMEVYRFNLRYRRPIKGKRSTPFMDLCVFKMSKKEWEKAYGDSPYYLLSARNGIVCCCFIAEEPPDEFLQDNKLDYRRDLLEFKVLTYIVNKNVPLVLDSFSFRACN